MRFLLVATCARAAVLTLPVGDADLRCENNTILQCARDAAARTTASWPCDYGDDHATCLATLALEALESDRVDDAAAKLVKARGDAAAAAAAVRDAADATKGFLCEGDDAPRLRRAVATGADVARRTGTKRRLSRRRSALLNI